MRERRRPKGGPDGGDGGRGGHVFLEGAAHLNTFWHMRGQYRIAAGHGTRGGKAGKTGSSGKDCLIKVPLGTVVRCTETGKKLEEILEGGVRCLFLRGGKGGRGNVHFKSATRQSPHYAQAGEPGTEQEVLLELKIMADVGLVGPPQCGQIHIALGAFFRQAAHCRVCIQHFASSAWGGLLSGCFFFRAGGYSRSCGGCLGGQRLGDSIPEAHRTQLSVALRHSRGHPQYLPNLP